jgi:hypothetical protein
MALRPGQVRDAILDFFEQHKGAAGSLQQIRAHVARVIGHDVPPSSVRSYLRLSDDFERVERGTYKRAQ